MIVKYWPDLAHHEQSDTGNGSCAGQQTGELDRTNCSAGNRPPSSPEMGHLQLHPLPAIQPIRSVNNRWVPGVTTDQSAK